MHMWTKYHNVLMQGP